jgi:hypothetical protein
VEDVPDDLVDARFKEAATAENIGYRSETASIGPFVIVDLPRSTATPADPSTWITRLVQ